MEHLEFLKPSLQKRQKRRDKRIDKELIECSRYSLVKKEKGSYKNKVKTNGYAHAKTQESMKFMHGGGTRYFTDNLEPLIRFLNTHQGKNWNKVYSELCAKLDRRSTAGAHVFNHLWDLVKLHVWIENRKPYHIFQGGVVELVSREKWPAFYVHPGTGQLRKAGLLNRKK